MYLVYFTLDGIAFVQNAFYDSSGTDALLSTVVP